MRIRLRQQTVTEGRKVLSEPYQHSLIQFAVLRDQDFPGCKTGNQSQVLQAYGIVDAVNVPILVGPYHEQFVIRTYVHEVPVIGEGGATDGILSDAFDLEFLGDRLPPQLPRTTETLSRNQAYRIGSH